MRRATLITIITTVISTLFLVGLAAAQTGAFAGLTQPLLVTVEQVVPVDVTVALPQADDTVLTATVPLTVAVNLQIKIDGASTNELALGKKTAFQILAMVPYDDIASYELQNPAPQPPTPWHVVWCGSCA